MFIQLTFKNNLYKNKYIGTHHHKDVFLIIQNICSNLLLSFSRLRIFLYICEE